MAREIVIRTHLSAENAALRGLTVYGHIDVHPTEKEWTGTTPSLRSAAVPYLASETGNPKADAAPALAVEDLGWSGVLMALQSLVATRVREELAEETAERDLAERAKSAAVAAKSLPVENWIRASKHSANALFACPPGMTDEVPLALLHRVTALCPEEMAAAHAEVKLRTEKREATEKAAQEQRRTEIRGFVLAAREFGLGIPDVKRAAAEGYDVTAPVLDHLQDQVGLVFDEFAIVHMFADGDKESRAWSWEDRPSPRPELFEIRDQIAAHVEAMPKPAGCEVRVGRISRAVEVIDGTKRKCTIIPVEIAVPSYQKRVVIFEVEGALHRSQRVD